MGKSYLFECPKCGHKAKVAGGLDKGLDVSIQTILCRDCKKLYDAILRLKVPANSSLRHSAIRLSLKKSAAIEAPPLFEKVVNQLPFPGSRKYEWMEYPMRCPVSPLHKIQVWKDPGKCPNCGVFLERNGLPFRIWE
jgi:hypothetical protein